MLFIAPVVRGKLFGAQCISMLVTGSLNSLLMIIRKCSAPFVVVIQMTAHRSQLKRSTLKRQRNGKEACKVESHQRVAPQI
jgi:hypothetical protein